MANVQFDKVLARILALALMPQLFAQFCPENFSGKADLGEPTLRDELGYSMVRIFCIRSPEAKEPPNSSGQGSGWILAFDSGFVLTAHHVISSCLDQKKTTLLADTARFPKQWMKLQVVENWQLNDVNIDATILKIDDQSLQRMATQLPPQSRAVDYRIGRPSDGESFLAGYPPNTDGSSEVSNPVLDVKRIKILVGSNDFDAPLLGGYSGGALLDGAGFAHAMHLKGYGNRGKYLPMYLLRKKLLEISKNKAFTEMGRRLNEGLRAGIYSKERTQLVQLLSSREITNADLQKVGLLIEEDRNAYEKSKAVLNCPLAKAMSDRGLDESVVRVADSKLLLATAYISQSLTARAAGDFVGSELVAQKALSLALQSQTNDLVDRSRLALGSAYLAGGKLDGGSVELTTVLYSANKRGDKQLAALTANYLAELEEANGNPDLALFRAKQAFVHSPTWPENFSVAEKEDFRLNLAQADSAALKTKLVLQRSELEAKVLFKFTISRTF